MSKQSGNNMRICKRKLVERQQLSKKNLLTLSNVAVELKVENVLENRLLLNVVVQVFETLQTVFGYQKYKNRLNFM